MLRSVIYLNKYVVLYHTILQYRLRFLAFFWSRNISPLHYLRKFMAASVITETIWIWFVMIIYIPPEVRSWRHVPSGVRSSAFPGFNAFNMFLLSFFPNILLIIIPFEIKIHLTLSELPASSLSTVANSSFWEHLTRAKGLDV